MDEFDFDDTKTSGIWWSTNLAIRDACTELKQETKCQDSEIICLLRTISESIAKDGI